jgi:hypothetical protein
MGGNLALTFRGDSEKPAYLRYDGIQPGGKYRLAGRLLTDEKEASADFSGTGSIDMSMGSGRHHLKLDVTSVTDLKLTFEKKTPDNVCAFKA